MEKQRNKRYELSQMEEGDRFYFVSDRKKTIYMLSQFKPFETVKQKQFWVRYGNCWKAGTVNVEKHKANTFVIFLRNINDNPGLIENAGAAISE